MKKYVVIIICVILILATSTSSSSSRRSLPKLTYAGHSTNWEAKADYNTNGNYQYNIKYLGNDNKTFKFNFKIEYISGNTSTGVGGYSDLYDKIGGFTLKFDNDLYNGDIKKYGNKNDLYIQINWNNKTETINLKKVE